jgi:hypothetical protein
MTGYGRLVRFMHALEPLGDRVQAGIATSLRFDLGDCGQNVIPVCPGSAMTLAHKMDLMLNVEAPGILGMAAVDQEDQRRNITLRRRGKRDSTHGFEIHGGDLFAFAQVRDGGVAVGCRHPVGDAAAGAAAVEAKYEAGLFRRAAVNEGIHA